MHQVRYFLAVADHLNFTRAAEALHVAQPSLTRAIQKLEEELGGPLFRRERANTHLTELGRMMQPHLAASLAAAEAAKRQALSFRKSEVGQLAIGACGTICVGLAAPVLATLVDEIPALDLHLEIRGQAELERQLLAGEIDAALLAPPGGLPERFDQRALTEEPFVAAFAPGHRFAKVAELALEALDGEPLVIRSGCGHEAALAAAMAARGINRVVRHRSGDERWLVELVRAGLGCCVLPATTARLQGLGHRVLADLPVLHRVVLATVAGRRHSPALAALVRRVERGATPWAAGAPARAASTVGAVQPR